MGEKKSTGQSLQILSLLQFQSFELRWLSMCRHGISVPYYHTNNIHILYIYIYIHREREGKRKRERETEKPLFINKYDESVNSE